jgi:hypothetical protein
MRPKQSASGLSQSLSVLRSIGVWSIYVAILLAVALYDGVHAPRTIFGAVVTPLATNAMMSEQFGLSDAGSYARGAREIVEHGWFREPSYKVLWPPGFFVLHAFLLALVGDSGPVLLGLLITSAATWALVFTSLYGLARRALSPLTSLLVPLLFLAFPFFRQYLLGEGVVFNESLSTAIWLLALLMLLKSANQGGRMLPIIAGATFAVAAYIRAQIDLVMIAMTGIFAALAVMYLVGEKYAIWTSKSRYVGLKRELNVLFISLLVFHALTIPYRVYKLYAHKSIMFSTANYYWQYHWMQPSEFTPAQGFILRGGGGAACHVDPTLCAKFREERSTRGDLGARYKEYQRAAISAFVHNPLKWTAYRIEHLPPYWFSRPAVTLPNGEDRLTGFVLAGLCVAGLLFAVGWANRRLGFTFLVAVLSLLFGNAAILMFVHYEVRYLYHAQAGAILLVLIAMTYLQALMKPPELRP